jgi:AraC-like DNA-binding protein
MNLYREFAPHLALSGYVACLWTSRAVPAGAPVRRRILPDNCIDILWQDRVPLGFVAGMMSRSHLFETARPLLTVAVRFRPGAARAFFDLPLHELQDGHPALDALWPRHEAEQLAAALWEGGKTVAQQLATIDSFLLARLRTAAPAPGERLVRAAVGIIETAQGNIRIEDLARSLGVSRQHLALQFRERVGLNAKTFAMVSRFRKAGETVRRQPGQPIDWAALALDCGYYDQSHLIHEFRLLADETPAAFAA